MLSSDLRDVDQLDTVQHVDSTRNGTYIQQQVNDPLCACSVVCSLIQGCYWLYIRQCISVLIMY